MAAHIFLFSLQIFITLIDYLSSDRLKAELQTFFSFELKTEILTTSDFVVSPDDGSYREAKRAKRGKKSKKKFFATFVTFCLFCFPNFCFPKMKPNLTTDN